MELSIETYILMAEGVIYICSITSNFYILYRYYKKIIDKLEKITRVTEPVTSEQPPDTARVDRSTAILMNAYHDTNRNVYEISPKH